MFASYAWTLLSLFHLGHRVLFQWVSVLLIWQDWFWLLLWPCWVHQQFAQCRHVFLSLSCLSYANETYVHILLGLPNLLVCHNHLGFCFGNIGYIGSFWSWKHCDRRMIWEVCFGANHDKTMGFHTLPVTSWWIFIRDNCKWPNHELVVCNNLPVSVLSHIY